MRRVGFTLAELLISLAILGVIATFTIPKVLNSSQDQTAQSIAKEAAGMIAEAYQTYKIENTVDASFGIWDLTPYINYVSITTTTQVQVPPNGGVTNCDLMPCLKMHNGSTIKYYTHTLGGLNTTNDCIFKLIPMGSMGALAQMVLCLLL